LLFLDEIQAAPELFAKLRWFREDMPDLPVIAVGSLLDFALNKYQYSMPVGRITYFYLEPMSFLEFVQASGHDALYRKLSSVSLASGIATSLHEKWRKRKTCRSITFDMARNTPLPVQLRFNR